MVIQPRVRLHVHSTHKHSHDWRINKLNTHAKVLLSSRLCIYQTKLGLSSKKNRTYWEAPRSALVFLYYVAKPAKPGGMRKVGASRVCGDDASIPKPYLNSGSWAVEGFVRDTAAVALILVLRIIYMCVCVCAPYKSSRNLRQVISSSMKKIGMRVFIFWWNSPVRWESGETIIWTDWSFCKNSSNFGVLSHF